MKKSRKNSNSILKTILVIITFILLTGCGSIQLKKNQPTNISETQTSQSSKNIAQNKHFAAVITSEHDTFESLAEKYLNDADLHWVIEDFNHVVKIRANQEIIIPLKSINPRGIHPSGYQTVPILCYHRFGKGHLKLSVSSNNFRKQLSYLKKNHYRVIPLKSLIDFLAGKKPIPKRSVVITIDDGYRSAHEKAFPILKEFNFPATVFLYSDFVGAKDSLTWDQMREMQRSGLVDFQSHSKSHPNLTIQQTDENNQAYLDRINNEIAIPSKMISQKFNTENYSFAYPYGEANDAVLAALFTYNLSLGVTVTPGSNSSFSHPLLLHRTMIFGDHSHEEFQNTLQTFKDIEL